MKKIEKERHKNVKRNVITYSISGKGIDITRFNVFKHLMKEKGYKRINPKDKPDILFSLDGIINYLVLKTLFDETLILNNNYIKKCIESGKLLKIGDLDYLSGFELAKKNKFDNIIFKNTTIFFSLREYKSPKTLMEILLLFNSNSVNLKYGRLDFINMILHDKFITFQINNVGDENYFIISGEFHYILSKVKVLEVSDLKFIIHPLSSIQKIYKLDESIGKPEEYKLNVKSLFKNIYENKTL